MEEFGRDVLPTFILIMTLFCDGACRTSCDAFPAGFIPEKETILFRKAVSLFAWHEF